MSVCIFVLAILWLGWNLQINGWGNPFYSAAVQAGAGHPDNLFFGSSDLGGGITIDKPPLPIWLSAPVVAVFGLGSWQVLITSVILGAGTSALSYLIARTFMPRLWSIAAGIFVMAVPVHVSMSRVNNPDSLLVFLFTAALLVIVRARRLIASSVLVGVILGCAILTKQLQALLIVPAVVAVLFTRFARRESLKGLVIGASTTLAVSLVWLVPVLVVPSGARPWIGGTQTDSILELMFGYNGIGRLTGSAQLGAVNPPGSQAPYAATDVGFRLLTVNFAPELLGFLPLSAAAVLVVAWYLKHRSRPSAGLAGVCIWLLTGLVVLNFMTGDIHPYYLSILAPPAGVLTLWILREAWVWRPQEVVRRIIIALGVLNAGFLLAGWTSWFNDGWPLLGKAMFASAAIAAAGQLIPGSLAPIGRKASAICFAMLALLPAIGFDAVTMSTPQQGSFFLSGPVPLAEGFHRRDAEQLAQNETEKMSLARGEGVSTDVVDLLEREKSRRWAALTLGSENAALYQLASGASVMSIGGFSGADGFPSQAQVENWARTGDVRYYINTVGLLKWSPVSPSIRSLAQWISTHYARLNVDGVELFDLTQPLPG